MTFELYYRCQSGRQPAIGSFIISDLIHLDLHFYGSDICPNAMFYVNSQTFMYMQNSENKTEKADTLKRKIEFVDMKEDTCG